MIVQFTNKPQCAHIKLKKFCPKELGLEPLWKLIGKLKYFKIQDYLDKKMEVIFMYIFIYFRHCQTRLWNCLISMTPSLQVLAGISGKKSFQGNPGENMEGSCGCGLSAWVNLL